MKWIGQHIWDFISRFRNDVYMEDLAEVEHEFSVMVGPDGKLTKSTHPGERSRIQVRNDEGATIPAGAPLYSKGEIGGSERILVGICDSSDTAKMPCIGVAEFEMNTTSTKDSFAVTQGVYNTNISGFTGLSVGDTLYVNGGSAPHLTQTKPTNGDLIQNVGIVLKTNGTICQGLLVSAIGRTNDVPWPLYVDHANQRVGVGTSSPQELLHIDNPTGASSILLEGAAGYNSQILFRTNPASAGGWLNYDYSANVMTFGTNASEKMRLTSAGRLGLGLSNPSFALDVDSGTANAAFRVLSTDRYTGIRFEDSLSNDTLFYDGQNNLMYLGSTSFRAVNLTATGTGSFAGQVTIPATPVASTDAASKGYVDAQIGANNDLQEVTDNGNTTTNSITFAGGTSTGNFEVNKGSAAIAVVEAGGANLKMVAGGATGYVGTYNNTNLTFVTNSSEKMRLTSGGNLLIGTTTDSGAKLNVNGTILCNNEIQFTNSAMRIYRSSDDMRFRTNNGDRLTIKNNGRIGIGTTSANAALDIQAGTADLRLTSTGQNRTALANTSTGFQISQIGNKAIYFETNGSERMRLNSTGLGIGTSSPDSLLEISSSSTSDFLKLTSAGGGANPIKLVFEKSSVEQGIIEYNRNGDLEIYNSDGDGGVMIDGSASSGADFYVANSGNVGIGTSGPANKLTVTTSTIGDGIRGISTDGYSWLKLQNDNSTTFPVGTLRLYYGTNQNVKITALSNEMKLGDSQNNMTFFTASSEKMRLTSTGRLGIGTSSPSARLQSVSPDGNTLSFRLGRADTSNFWDFNHAGNDLRIYNEATSGSNILLGVDAGGTVEANNVGIGTATPSRPLHVKNTSSQTVAVFDGGNNSAGEIGFLSYGTSGDTYVTIGAVVNDMSFSAGASERMRLTSDGKLGIGTTSPAQTLHIYKGGNAGALIEGTNVSYLKLKDPSSDGHIGTYNDGTLRIGAQNNAATTHLVIKSDGKIGINTASPSQKLEVEGGRIKISSSGTQQLLFGTDATIEFGSDGNIQVRRTSSDLQFKTGGSEKMRLTSTGRLGIGTTSPSEKLQILGNVRIDSSSSNGQNLQFRNNGVANALLSNSYHISGVSASTTDFNVFVYSNNPFNIWTNSNKRLTIDGSGNVGIGTSSPSYLLTVDSSNSSGPDNVAFFNSASNNERILIGSANQYIEHKGSEQRITLASEGSAGTFTVRTNGSERMRLTSTGRLGIGTTSPDQLIHAESSSDTAIKVKKTGGNYIQLTAGGAGGRIASDHQINFDAGGNPGAMLISAAGKVGIGTNSPQRKLHIHESSGSVYLQMTQGSTGVTSNDGFQIAMGATQVNLINRENGPMLFDTNNSTKMSLLSNGNLLIGTTTGSEKLVVAGNIQVNGSNDSADGLHLKDRTFVAFSDDGSVVSRFRSSSAGVFQFQDGSYNTGIELRTNGRSYFNGGNVLIGTTTDSGAKLDVSGVDNGVFFRRNTSQYFKFTTDAHSNRIESAGKTVFLGTTDAQPLYLKTNDSSRLTITSGGNVLIGTTTDSGAKLKITTSETSTTSTSLYLENTGSGGNEGVSIVFNPMFGATSMIASNREGVGSNATNLSFHTCVVNDDPPIERMRLTSGGNLLIATTTDDGSSKLQVDGDVKFYGDTSGRDMLWDASLNSLLISSQARLRLGGTNDFWIFHDGTDSQIINRASGDLIISGQVVNGDIRLINQAGGGASNYIVLDSSQETVNIYQNTLIGTTSDDGSSKLQVAGDVKFYGATSNRDLIWKQAQDALILKDSAELRIGTGYDLRLYHDGSNSRIRNNNGDLYISQNSDAKDIIFTCDNGSGGTTDYITLDGSQTTINLQKTVLIGTTTNTGVYKIDVAGKQRVQDTLELDDVLMLNAISTPSDPAAGKSVIYMDSSDGGIKCKINVGGTVVTRTLASFE